MFASEDPARDQPETAIALDSETWQLRQRLAVLASASQAVVIGVGPHGRLISAEGSLPGQASDPDGPIGAEIWALVRRTPLASRMVEQAKRGATASGEIVVGDRALDARFLPLRDDDGRLDGYLVVATGLPGAGAAEGERHERRLQDLTVLAAGMAHDFNNLLTTIMSVTGILGQSASLDAPDRSQLEVITLAAKRAAELSHRLLAFARGATQAAAPVDLREVVSGVLQLAAPVLPEDIAVVSGVSRTPLLVRGHAPRLEQAVLNLVLNARDAIRGSGHIWVRASVDEGSAVVAVADDGKGMDEQTRERAFEPFFTTRADRGGTGLGLAMVRDTVVTHGGSITVRSTRGRGTTFEMRLPLLSFDEAPRLEPAADAATYRSVRALLDRFRYGEEREREVDEGAAS
jgi:signal transduction histidine kinase